MLKPECKQPGSRGVRAEMKISATETTTNAVYIKVGRKGTMKETYSLYAWPGKCFF